MKRALFAWIGKNDLDAASSDGARGLGAICQSISSRNYGKVVLLSDWPADKTQGYFNWIRARTSAELEVRSVELANPTDIPAVYDYAKRTVQETLRGIGKGCEVTFHLSSGTWAMASVWIILANSFFTATLIKSSPEEGVQDVYFPFELAADYLPDLVKRKDKAVGPLFDGGSADAPAFSNIIHRSEVVLRLLSKAQKAAPHFLPVLILGESGTGKELLASAIHKSSLCKGRFVAVNCGAIPASLIESELFGHAKGAFTGAAGQKHGLIKAAAGGTLFLDEVGELPLGAQVKFLRVLQEGTFTPVGAIIPETTDARIIAATNRNLLEEVAAGRFREDLFHRLAVAMLYVPPLREREGDLIPLIDHLLREANRRLSKGAGHTPKKLSSAARTVLLQHHWPGNVRELQNTLLRAALWSDGNVLEKQDIEEALLPAPPRSGSNDEGRGDVLGVPLGDGFDLEGILGEVARHYLKKAMTASGGNKSKASRLLNFKSYQTLDNWLKRYGLRDTPSS
ncbi:sigma 54-interacting transcriptional regulator [Geomonas sp. RF6]|uniref:sigma-54 interaction domain-containing protein n=1 Tax=Geomonas sp. RF6 TaxID=2897342 RepID=UPI001E2B59F0|nr:sigma 54-interacting transcriptional regulator [Geomonas sp. RF6]UFS72496.1 sigma 54-interacting transcriptional regulator [Geomonas sp. RF6]